MTVVFFVSLSTGNFFFFGETNTHAQQTQQQMRDLRSTQLPTEGAAFWL